MAIMTAVDTDQPDVVVLDGPFTVAQWAALPDDGRRHELLDGMLVMAAAPRRRHQEVVKRLTLLLDAAAPDWAQVLPGPFAVKLPGPTVLEPDVLVARRAELTEEDLPTVPLLSVEVLSPSTRSFDLTEKKAILEREGCPSYWVIDPQRLELTAFELVDGAYVEVAQIARGEPWEATAPFPVTVVVQGLLDD